MCAAFISFRPLIALTQRQLTAELTARELTGLEYTPGSTVSKCTQTKMLTKMRDALKSSSRFSSAVSVKLAERPPIDGEEVGGEIVGRQWVEELGEDGTEVKLYP